MGNPCGANGQITMTVHNYRSRQVHETLNGVNPSSGFRDMRSAKSGSNLWQIWQVFSPWASPYGANGQMSMTVHNYRPRQFHRTSNWENPSSGYRDMGSASLAAARPTARPPARPPGPWRQYPSSPEGWGVKRCNRQTDRHTDGKYHSLSCLDAAKNNRAPLLYYIKLCVSFQIHWWIQTEVTLLKRSIRVEIGDFLSLVTLKFDGWPWKRTGHLFHTTSSFWFVAVLALKFFYLSSCRWFDLIFGLSLPFH